MLVDERSNQAMMLESAEVDFIQIANKRRLQPGLDDEAAKKVPEKSRPKHRLTPIIGKKVDTIRWTKKTIPDMSSQIEKLQKDTKSQASQKSTAVFVLFETQAAAQRAFSDVDFHRMLPVKSRYMAIEPKEVIWSNLKLSSTERTSRMAAATGFVVAIVLLWSIPVGIIGTISNVNYLTDKVKFLRFIDNLPPAILGIITGLLPPTLLSTFVSYVPKFFRCKSLFSSHCLWTNY